MSLYEIKINFDEASYEWRKNKKYIGNGCFEYKCKHICKDGSYCKNKIYLNGMCKYHLRLK